MTTMLIVDTRDRQVNLTVANVTRSEAGLVVRPAVEVGALYYNVRQAAQAAARAYREPYGFRTGMPILILGDGYQARSSEGFVRVSGQPADDPQASHAVVGWLDKGRGLRRVRPLRARIFQACEVELEGGTPNSNPGTAYAVRASLDLLAQVRPTSVFVTEGQSDTASIWRFTPVDEREDTVLPLEEIKAEHREEMFSCAALGQALASWSRWLRSPKTEVVNDETGEVTMKVTELVSKESGLESMSYDMNRLEGHLRTFQPRKEEERGLTLRAYLLFSAEQRAAIFAAARAALAPAPEPAAKVEGEQPEATDSSEGETSEEKAE